MDAIENILFPTDFSENASNALPYVIDLVRKNNAKLSLLHVYDIPLAAPSSVFSTRVETMSSLSEEIRSKSLERLKEIIKAGDLEEVPHRCYIRQGSVQDEIQKIAKDQNVQLIVMGTKGKSAKRDILIGSIARKVMQQSTCPVLAIPEDASFHGISNIVHATDLLYNESVVLDFLTQLAKIYSAKLTLLHIDHDPEEVEKSRHALEEAIHAISHPDTGYKQLLVEGVLDGINEYVSGHEVDVLSMTTHNVTLFDKLFHNSITEKMLLHTHIPLLATNQKKYDTIFLG